MSKKEKQKMSKKERLAIIIVLVLLVLFFPIPTTYLDGGTTELKALTYTLTIHKGNFKKYNQEKNQDEVGYRKGFTLKIFGKEVFDNKKEILTEIVTEDGVIQVKD